jgi:PAS domain S-box-containing protein
MERNIKERQQAEEALEQLQQQNELILQSAGEGIYGLDQQGNTTFVNPAAAQILGWSPEDLLGKPQHDLIHHTKPDGVAYDRQECPIYAAIKDGLVHTVNDELFWRKDGTSLPVEYTSTPMRDKEGKLAGAVVTFRDITQRQQAEQALRAALAEVERLKDQLQAENVYLQEEIRLEHNFDNIISTSESFKMVLRSVEQVAATDATVLILGETGTGKELIARALHTLSPRKERPLVKVNCAALPANLIESELFGHEKGAFTGALSRKQGRFELADRGTIFLDEIGDLPLDLQAKLLRALQEGEFERVGGEQTIKVDVRVIAATNRNLEEACRSRAPAYPGHTRENQWPH